MGFYPALLNLKDRRVVVIGGGRVAGRKVAALAEAGARVALVAPRLAAETREVCESSGVELHQREYAPGDLAGAWLAVSATDLEDLNRAVAAEAEERGIFCNVVDVPRLCSFIVPASITRGDLVLAVSTGGASPAAARRLRQRLQSEFGPEWGPYLRLLHTVRLRLTDLGRPAAENRPLFYALVDSELFEMVSEGDAVGVDRVLERELGPGFSLAELGLTAGDLAAGEEEGR